jgi:hypothetical protein
VRATQATALADLNAIPYNSKKARSFVLQKSLAKPPQRLALTGCREGPGIQSIH